MTAPRIPLNEAERIAALQTLEILDTPPEERFDRLTRLARRLFNVPVALVSLVDTDRQWFKSVDGLSFTQTTRDVSFCGHTILEENLFIVPDTTVDARFHDNPLVTDGPRIRFYAGCPLTMPGGITLGSICLMDTRPRTFSEEDQRSLRDIGQIVIRELVAFELATTDELTRIPNRRAFERIAQHALNICKRSHKPAVLTYFDLDNFKAINDSFGHAEGDRALVEFVTTLRGAVRNTDVIGRLGGDEFAAIFVDTDDIWIAAIWQRIRETLAQNRARNRNPYPIDFSTGTVTYDASRHPTVGHMLEDADRAMYLMKQSRRSRPVTAREAG
ncbi:diguanylate cyclase with GAF sensor [Paraburkholderia eburnea]|uniref:Diguanylate cyclase with GAF sensor n=1 Tax=Paraburkholderia eburnea TaxID=1189126 RepID=A0A2S4LV31_9BURK|nr:sensor domain-containing diguanylate cyclase [Paraburkholderia eburnea]POR46298.1 diguanylate cyclase with GAF sensor [Paraburkholderia eburnea]PRZ16251.1 diguanylate cyclase with GAF sensor [Paraburkholderia eburnea]